jgi:branched-subunit amino acid ABC-type transport system permease component
MDGFKSLLASKTFWGAFVAIVGGVLSAFGYSVAPEDLQKIVEGIGHIATFAGALGSIYGCVVASKQIG